MGRDDNIELLAEMGADGLAFTAKTVAALIRSGMVFDHEPTAQLLEECARRLEDDSA